VGSCCRYRMLLLKLLCCWLGGTWTTDAERSGGGGDSFKWTAWGSLGEERRRNAMAAAAPRQQSRGEGKKDGGNGCEMRAVGRRSKSEKGLRFAEAQ
jgi:hypothetical protein